MVAIVAVAIAVAVVRGTSRRKERFVAFTTILFGRKTARGSTCHVHLERFCLWGLCKVVLIICHRSILFFFFFFIKVSHLFLLLLLDDRAKFVRRSFAGRR